MWSPLTGWLVWQLSGRDLYWTISTSMSENKLKGFLILDHSCTGIWDSRILLWKAYNWLMLWQIIMSIMMIVWHLNKDSSERICNAKRRSKLSAHYHFLAYLAMKMIYSISSYASFTRFLAPTRYGGGVAKVKAAASVLHLLLSFKSHW